MFLSIILVIYTYMVKIFYGKTRDSALHDMLLDLKKRYNRGEHYVFLVPDRVSVLCEKLIFEVLDIDSTVNIEVLTLSRLSARILKDTPVISREESVMLMQRALLESRENLKCFKKNLDLGLASSIFGTISQFKSCKVEPKDVVVSGAGGILRDKLSDIAYLYEKYEALLSSRHLHDSMDRLNLLPQKMRQSSFIKDSHFYVAMFDGFTLQGYEIVASLIDCAKSFNIGLLKGSSPLNEHIYDTDFAQNILNLCSKSDVQKIICEDDFTTNQRHIADNLFSLSPSRIMLDNEGVVLFEGENVEEEVTFALSEIKRLVMTGHYAPQDFFIALPHLMDKREVVERVMDKFSFPYFVDLAQDFSTSCMFLLVKSFFEIIRDNWSMTSILSFIFSPLLDMDRGSIEAFDDYVRKFRIDNIYTCATISIQDEASFAGFDSLRSYILGLKEGLGAMFDNASTYGDYIAIVGAFLNKIDISSLLAKQIEYFTSIGDERNVRLFDEYYDKMQSLLDGLGDILADESVSLADFISTLTSGAMSISVSTVPLSVDAVFVGDTSLSFFERRKMGFVLSCQSQEFPLSQSDVGLITDKDIVKVSEKYRLEPSIKEINRKERFKAFELLLKPRERIYLSYNYDKGGEKSSIIGDVQALFCEKYDDGTTSPLRYLKFSDLPFDMQNSNINIARRNLTAVLRGTLDRVRVKSEQDATLYAALKDKLPKEYLSNFFYKVDKSLSEDIFFASGKTSISEIERYMTCPFMHYMEYGLRVKDRDSTDIDARRIGQFLHSFVEDFIRHTSLPIDENLIDSKTQEVFDKVLEKKEFLYMFTTPSDIVIKQNFLLEAQRIARALNYQAQNSHFVPKYIESRYDDVSPIRSLKIRTKKGLISLVGKIDRIDVYDQYFRVIDYKTGNTDYSLKELFFGKKIQLEAYIKVVGTSLPLKCAGAYYLPIKNTLSTDEESVHRKYRLKGRTLDSGNIICASDKNLVGESIKSDIVEIATNKDGSLSKTSKVLSSSEMSSLSNYAYNLILRAVKDISSLNITPRPLYMGSEGACDRCPYRSICQFDTAFGGVKRMVDADITAQSFEEER